MKLSRLLTLVGVIGFVQVTFAVEQDHYTVYAERVEYCILDQQKLPNVSATQLPNLKQEVLATAIFYLKEKRIVDCSSTTELRSLVIALNSGESLDSLKYKYLSFGLVEAESKYLLLSLNERKQIENSLLGYNLEVDLLKLFDGRE